MSGQRHTMAIQLPNFKASGTQPLDRPLGGSNSRSGICSKEKNCAVPEIKVRSSSLLPWLRAD